MHIFIEPIQLDFKQPVNQKCCVTNHKVSNDSFSCAVEIWPRCKIRLQNFETIFNLVTLLIDEYVLYTIIQISAIASKPVILFFLLIFSGPTIYLNARLDNRNIIWPLFVLVRIYFQEASLLFQFDDPMKC